MDTISTSSTTDLNRAVYPVEFVLLRNIYGHTIHDVEGVVLTDDNGVPVNVFSGLKEMFESKGLKLTHDVVYGYRYFTINGSQKHIFQTDRDFGSVFNNTKYYVYPDEDYVPPPIPIRRRTNRAACFRASYQE